MNAEIGSIRQIGLERIDLRCQLLDPRVEAAHVSMPLFQVASEQTLSSSATKKRTHGISCKVRYAARAGE